MNLVRAVIKLEVPEYQIDQPVTVYFKDTMRKYGICDKEQEKGTCKNCKYHYNEIRCHCNGFMPDHWYCAGWVKKDD